MTANPLSCHDRRQQPQLLRYPQQSQQLQPPPSQYQQQQSYPSRPASPTLTDPDMILPEDGPSDSEDDRIRAHDLSVLSRGPWSGVYRHLAPNADSMLLLSGKQSDRHFVPASPITPTTPTTPTIIYGNGTMLSDIGEVTEAESTASEKPSPVSTKPYSAIYKRRSPMPHTTRTGRQSTPSPPRGPLESLRDQGDLLFDDFDDAFSVGDSVFQGDDEESVASFADEGLSSQSRYHSKQPYDDEDMSALTSNRINTSSAAALSRRAEQILATAKKRLNSMESNLSQARSSLYSPPPITSPTSDIIVSPVNYHSHNHQRISYDGVTFQNSPPLRQELNRVASDYKVTGSEHSQRTLDIRRSVEKLGDAGNRDGGRMHLSTTTTHSQSSRELAPLQPLREDEDDFSDATFSDHSSSLLGGGTSDVASRTSSRLRSHGTRSKTPTDARSLHHRSSSSTLRPRSRTSVTQMRHLKDQMTDLKGKISSLREQTRADSLKRQSLQSLRSPSPFTNAHAEPWYSSETGPRGLLSPIDMVNSGTSRNPWNGEESSTSSDEGGPKHNLAASDLTLDDARAEAESPIRAITAAAVTAALAAAAAHDPPTVVKLNGRRRSVIGLLSPASPSSLQEDDVNALLPTGGDVAVVEEVKKAEDDAFYGVDGDDNAKVVEDMDVDYESESGESLYHDTSEHPISHEDRIDAFDYEHFFLHSALGTIGRQRNGSSSSSNSVETARGPVVEEEEVDQQDQDQGITDARATDATTNHVLPGIAADSQDIDNIDAAAAEEPSKRVPRMESLSRKTTSRMGHRMHRGSNASLATVDSFATATESGFPTSTDGRASVRSSVVFNPAHDVEPVQENPAIEDESSEVKNGKSRRSRAGTLRRSFSLARKANFSVKRPVSAEPRERVSMPHNQYLHHPSGSSAYRPMGTSRSMSVLHRPSTASLGSVGTTRSFPLVNRARKSNSTSVLTSAPFSSPSDQDLPRVSDALLRALIASAERGGARDLDDGAAGEDDDSGKAGIGFKTCTSQGVMAALSREDQYLVERVITSMGRCVLGLVENGRTSPESRVHRRRIMAAQRFLEGLNINE